MTASSGPGISLMQEGISYMAGAELPGVIVNIMRAGPGLGNLGVEQGDYFQSVKGGGHGNYRTPVFAPNSIQEMCDLTIHAFEVADRYRDFLRMGFKREVTGVEEPDYGIGNIALERLSPTWKEKRIVLSPHR